MKHSVAVSLFRAVVAATAILILVPAPPAAGKPARSKRHATAAATAGSRDPYRDYIERFSELAVAQQAEYGIPASITLAQGLLESAAGRSTLATEGNNHFGIKCHSTWTGPSMLRDDDAPDECFRVYGSAEESFTDHSRFLSRKRYERLFRHDITDYAAWAKGLSECGYATDPNYASRLITIIERYSLFSFDTDQGRHAEAAADFIADMLRQSHTVRRSRGLHYVIATPGDTYTSIASEFKIDPHRLRAFNDADETDNIKEWEEVYLEEKLESAPKGVKKATVGEGESFHSVAQRFGMKLSVIVALNPKAKDRPGTRLKLR